MAKTKRTTPEINLTHNGKILNNEIIKNFYDFVQENFDEYSFHDYDKNWHRINYCTAWYYKTNLSPTCIAEPTNYAVTFIRSYNTIVGLYFPEFQALISFGRYSMTTYQHIAKFRNNNRFNISYEYNMEYENWF